MEATIKNEITDADIEHAVKNMVSRTIKYAKEINIKGNVKPESTTQINVEVDVRTIFLDDLVSMIGVQSVHFNKYTNKTEISFVLFDSEVEKIVSLYGGEF